MSLCEIVTDIDSVDYGTKCCCQTTDAVYYQVPKEYFRLNANLARRKLSVAEPFSVPLDSATFEKFLFLLEKVSILATAAAEDILRKTEEEKTAWMGSLTKRQQKFVDSCLGIMGWDGKYVPLYEKSLPEINDVVWVKITQVNDTSAVVQLLEYGKREGIIPYTEVTRNRVRSMGKLIKIGRTEAVQVIRMDKAKGYIDLSKKLVTLKEAKACKENYRKGSEVRSIVCHVAEECDLAPMEAMERIAFPLYRRTAGKHAWDWLYELNRDQNCEEIVGPLNLPQAVVDCLMATLKNAMRKKVETLEAKLEITCFACDGVDAIRNVLLMGRDYTGAATGDDHADTITNNTSSNENEANHTSHQQQLHVPLSMAIIGPPLYALRTRTELKEEGLLRMEEAIEMMKVEIAKYQGQLRVVTPPQALGDFDAQDKAKYSDEDDDELS